MPPLLVATFAAAYHSFTAKECMPPNLQPARLRLLHVLPHRPMHAGEFVRNYNGNRAPLGIYLHAGAGLMAVPEHAEQVRAQTVRWMASRDGQQGGPALNALTCDVGACEDA